MQQFINVTIYKQHKNGLETFVGKHGLVNVSNIAYISSIEEQDNHTEITLLDGLVLDVFLPYYKMEALIDNLKRCDS